MSPRTILTLASGRGLDLRHPTATDYADWDWQAEHLAKENRYNGATPGVTYSVAEHTARGAQAIVEDTGNTLLAAYFLVHDNPESALKDDTTPKKRAIAEEAEALYGINAEHVLAVYSRIEAKHEAAVHTAAGLSWPLSAEHAASVKYWDKVMFVTEWRDLMGGIPHPDWSPYATIPTLPRRILAPLDWRRAKKAWLNCAYRLLPVFQQSGTR